MNRHEPAPALQDAQSDLALGLHLDHQAAITLGPHSSTSFNTRTDTFSWNPRDANA